jgi:glycosyltransferase involved in cell wall biosynthesis
MPYPSATELPTPPGDKQNWPWTVATPPDQEIRFYPRITVVTPSYNQGQFIEATIRSVLLQSYPNLEYIIMDGRSTDNSVEIIQKYDPWITFWASEPDRGQSHAINKGLERGTGEIFAWLNSDDMLLPGALKHIAFAYQTHPDAVSWIGRCHRIRLNGRIINTIVPRGLARNNLADWFYDGFFYQPACFFSAKAWQTVGGVDESLNFAMDFDLWLRLSAIGQFVEVPETIAAAVIHDEAKTRAQKPEVHVETMFVQYKYGFQNAAVNRLKRVMAASAGQQQGLGKKWKQRARQLLANNRPKPENIPVTRDVLPDKDR